MRSPQVAKAAADAKEAEAVRVAAVQTLGALPSNDAAAALAQLLGDGSPAVRVAAALALGQLARAQVATNRERRRRWRRRKPPSPARTPTSAMRQAVASRAGRERTRGRRGCSAWSRRSSCPMTCATTWPGCCATVPSAICTTRRWRLPAAAEDRPEEAAADRRAGPAPRRRRQGQDAAGRQRQKRHAMPQMPHDPRRRRPGRPRPVHHRQEGQPREPVRVDPATQQGHRRPVPPLEDRQEWTACPSAA